MVSEGAILGNTAHFASARTRTGAQVWVIGREAMDAAPPGGPRGLLPGGRADRPAARRRVRCSPTRPRASASRPLLAPRREHDLLGEREVPGRRLLRGADAARRENFAISGVPLRDFSRFIDAFAFVKKAAALANARARRARRREARRDRAGLRRDPRAAAARPVRRRHDPGRGGHLDQHERQRGDRQPRPRAARPRARASTRTSIQRRRERSQSPTTPIPPRIKLGRLPASRDRSRRWRSSGGAADKAEEFARVLKMGRTELQDAVPMTLGQEFGAYATMVGEARGARRRRDELLDVSLGATAIGTGITSPPGYAGLVHRASRRVSGLPCVASRDLVEATQDSGEFVELSGALKRAAVQISKICNDLRLLSSGPRAGFGEINLPRMQPGSLDHARQGQPGDPRGREPGLLPDHRLRRDARWRRRPASSS